VRRWPNEVKKASSAFRGGGERLGRKRNTKFSTKEIEGETRAKGKKTDPCCPLDNLGRKQPARNACRVVWKKRWGGVIWGAEKKKYLIKPAIIRQ